VRARVAERRSRGSLSPAPSRKKETKKKKRRRRFRFPSASGRGLGATTTSIQRGHSHAGAGPSSVGSAGGRHHPSPNYPAAPWGYLRHRAILPVHGHARCIRDLGRPGGALGGGLGRGGNSKPTTGPVDGRQIVAIHEARMGISPRCQGLPLCPPVSLQICRALNQANSLTENFGKVPVKAAWPGLGVDPTVEAGEWQRAPTTEVGGARRQSPAPGQRPSELGNNQSGSPAWPAEEPNIIPHRSVQSSLAPSFGA